MSVVGFHPLTQQQYLELEHQMETTPDPNTIYTEWGAHPHLEELFRKYGYPPAGRFEAYEWAVKFLEMGYEETDTRSMDGTGQPDVTGRCYISPRRIQSDGIPLRSDSDVGAVRVQSVGTIPDMGLGDETVGRNSEVTTMDIPDFLKIGAPVWCGFAGWIEDIAIGTDTLMVKVESPKKKLYAQRDEWLPYREGIMRPLLKEDLLFDVGIYSERRDKIVKDFNDAVDKLTGILYSEEYSTPKDN